MKGLFNKALRSVLALALVCTCMVAAPISFAAADAQVTTINTAAQWNTFAAQVNAGDTYEGVTVTLAADLSGTSLTSVGTAEHPFEGTFNGGNHEILNLRISAAGTENVTYLGLFGHVGMSGTIENLQVSGSITVTDAESYVKYVGGVAGLCEGKIYNCESEVAISITSLYAGSVESSTEGEYEDTDNEGITFEAIGGVAGACYNDMSACSFAGSIYIHTDQMGSTSGTIGQNIGGIVGIFGGYAHPDENGENCTRYYKGRTDISADEADEDVLATLSNCSNSGSIKIESTCENGLDRFGQTAYTSIANVGGVAGYCMGNISYCSNSADVNTHSGTYREDSYRPSDTSELQRIANGDAVGGVVGNLRSAIHCGSTSSSTGGDPGLTAGRQRTLCACTNSAEVLGLHAVGGIIGCGGANTTLKGCKNEGDVTATRWNKPAPGGIAGQSYGNVIYCYNWGDVMTETGGGYYAAGIVGMLFIYTDSTTGKALHDTPEVYACYNVGTIWASGSYLSAAIVGENEGYVHNCAWLNGCNPSNGNAVVADNVGTYVSTYCPGATQANFMRKVSVAGKSNTPVPCMNRCAIADGWELYYVIPTDEDAKWPELNIWLDEEPTSIEGCSGSVSADDVTDAGFSTASTPQPTLDKCTVTINGTATTLYNYCDYKVVVDAGNTAAGTYTATIEGNGYYAGVPLLTFN